MSFLAIFQLLSQVLAAAPSVEADVESAMNAFHASTGNDAAKTQAVVDAVQHIAAVGGQIVQQATTQPTPPVAAS